MKYRLRIVLNICLLLFTVCFIPSCKKYLDAKSDSKLNIPSTLPDLQALLDDYQIMNQLDIGVGEISADNYYMTKTNWDGLLQDGYRRMYIWEKDNLFIGTGIGSSQTISNWSNAHKPIYLANIVLENTDRVPRNESNKTEWDNIKGQALFFRAKTFLQNVLVWSLAYDAATASTDLGIPLRLTSNINEPSVRSTVQQSYDQILKDFKEASGLLSTTQITGIVSKIRPNKVAAYGFLARTYLAMRNYDSCFKYADLCLQLHSTLMNYNTDIGNINGTSTPFSQFNPEIIFESTIATPAPLSTTRAIIDSNLYKSYVSNDKRQKAFFRTGPVRFKGSYSTAGLFSGIATDEVYLMRAECYARKGNVTAAMNDLNTLLVKRWTTNTFVPYTAADATDALNKILVERRKELLMRNIRWMDLKRLNKEGANIILTRILISPTNTQTYTLPPNDPRYALPLPESVIELTGMPQNPR